MMDIFAELNRAQRDAARQANGAERALCCGISSELHQEDEMSHASFASMAFNASDIPQAHFI